MGTLRMPDDVTIGKLLVAAKEAMKMSYAPYSQFNVGAALLDSDGNIFTGCNVENASHGAAICAERTAITKAISEGAREFEAIAIVGGPHGEVRKNTTPPCGICRQVLSELCPPDMPVILGKEEGFECYSVEELLPVGFIL